MSGTAIGRYAIISDCHSAALVSSAGSIDWLCRPRFDSASLFARLLDESGGHFSIAPAGEFSATRRYLDRTMVLETALERAQGVVRDAIEGAGGSASDWLFDWTSVKAARVESLARATG